MGRPIEATDSLDRAGRLKLWVIGSMRSNGPNHVRPINETLCFVFFPASLLTPRVPLEPARYVIRDSNVSPDPLHWFLFYYYLKGHHPARDTWLVGPTASFSFSPRTSLAHSVSRHFSRELVHPACLLLLLCSCWCFVVGRRAWWFAIFGASPLLLCRHLDILRSTGCVYIYIYIF